MNKEEFIKRDALINKIYKETEEYGRMQFVTKIVDLEQALNEIKEYVKKNCIEIDGKYTELVCEGEELLQIIDKVGGNE